VFQEMLPFMATTPNRIWYFIKNAKTLTLTMKQDEEIIFPLSFEKKPVCSQNDNLSGTQSLWIIMT